MKHNRIHTVWDSQGLSERSTAGFKSGFTRWIIEACTEGCRAVIYSRVYRGSDRCLHSRINKGIHGRSHNRFSVAFIAGLLKGLPGECSACFAARF